MSGVDSDSIQADDSDDGDPAERALDRLRAQEGSLGVFYQESEDAPSTRAAADFARDISNEEDNEEEFDNEDEVSFNQLDIGGMHLTEFPVSELRGYERAIEQLDAYDNQLTDLPAEIADLQNLVSLDVSNNRFDSIPEVIGSLASLQTLSLAQNRIRKIGGKLLNLANLRILECHLNAISEISPQIGSLAYLQEFDVASNFLVDLPEELTDLSRLILLRLTHNKIRRIPNSIGRLASLSHFDISDNKLRSLPPGVQFLQNLEVLDVSSNDISIIPTQIGQLRRLRTLNLADNTIKQIPTTIGKLSQLEELNLSDNQIETLPRELGNLPDYVNIVLSDNPLAEPLPSFVERGTQALLSYLRSLGDGTPQYEAKALLVGEGGVGKSSLVAALRGDQFVSDRPTTHGIELSGLELEHPDLNLKLQLNTWDFGGQEVYRITHQFFFSRRALYLLVWKPREGHEENNVEAWCRRIRLRVGDHARIIIVATHADERRPEFDYEFLRAKFPNLVVGYAAVDSGSGRGIDSLKTLMAIEASKLPQMGEMISRSWTAAREDILSRSDAQISRSTFERVCMRHGLDEDQTEALSALMHDLGHVIHYADDDGLRDIIVLQPEWLTKAIGYVLEDEETRRCGGVLQHDSLRSIWSQRDGRGGYETSLHRYFLRLMEKFDVSYRLSTDNESLVAQLVPYERPSSVWQDTARNGRPYRSLKVICRLSEEAAGLIAWLTVRNHRFSTGQHWRRGVVLEHKTFESQAVFELDHDNVHLKLSVIGPAPDYFFHVLRDGLEDLIIHRWKGLSYEFLIPCPSRDDSGQSCVGTLPLNVLIRFRQRGESSVICHTCANWVDVNKVLTGIGRLTAPLDVILGEIRRFRESFDEQVITLSAVQAETARHVRMALKLISTEVVDCPRFFTLVPRDRGSIRSNISLHDDLELTLWCEEPGHEHPCNGGVYRFKPAKGWVDTVAPYVRFISRFLRAVTPVAGAVYGAVVDENQLKQSKADLDLMKVLADKLPENPFSSNAGPMKGMSRSEGAGLRALRTALMKMDPNCFFGGMRRVVSESGDYLWVCQHHYVSYDPGLPHLQ